MLQGYADVANLPEDDRIKLICETVSGMRQGQTVGVVTDAELGKADRYIAKMKARLPGIDIIEKIENCPFVGTTTIKVGPPKINRN